MPKTTITDRRIQKDAKAAAEACLDAANEAITDAAASTTNHPALPPRAEIVKMARDQRVNGTAMIEIDDDAEIAEPQANGCFLAAWVWVEFPAAAGAPAKDFAQGGLSNDVFGSPAIRGYTGAFGYVRHTDRMPSHDRAVENRLRNEHKMSNEEIGEILVSKVGRHLMDALSGLRPESQQHAHEIDAAVRWFRSAR